MIKWKTARMIVYYIALVVQSLLLSPAEACVLDGFSVQPCNQSTCELRKVLVNHNLVGPTSEELWENVRFVHLTDLLRNNQVVPGSSTVFSFKNPNPIPDVLQSKVNNGTAPFHIVSSSDAKQLTFFDIHHVLPHHRITSHWHVYEGIHDAVGSSQWGNKKIAIIEKAKHFKGKLYGGNNRDFMVIGPHQLSAEAYLIAPRSLENKLRADNPNFKGHFWIYEDTEFKNAAEAVDHFNEIYSQAYPESWVMLSEKKPQNSEQRYSRLLELIVLGNSDEPVYDQIIQELRDILTRGGLRSFADSPAAELFFQQKYGQAETHTLNFNGKLQYARKVFSSWIKEDGIPWTMHYYDFIPLEESITKLSRPIECDLIQQHLKKYGWKSCHQSALTPDEANRVLTEIRLHLQKVEKKLSHLSPEVQTYFRNYKKNLQSWFPSLGD